MCVDPKAAYSIRMAPRWAQLPIVRKVHNLISSRKRHGSSASETVKSGLVEVEENSGSPGKASMSRQPVETLLQILSHLGLRDLKSARLVSKRWADCAAEYLFQQLFISRHDLNIKVFKTITQHPKFSKYVKELVFDTAHFKADINFDEYFDILWPDLHLMIQRAPPPIINEGERQNYLNTIWSAKERLSLEYMDPTESMKADLAKIFEGCTFVKKGYHEWLDLATQEKCLDREDYAKILSAGLKNLPQWDAVRFFAESYQGHITLYPRPDTETGSPTSRSRNPLYARALSSNESVDSEFGLTTSLLHHLKRRIHQLDFDAAATPYAFETALMTGNPNAKLDLGIYSTLRHLKLSLSAYDDHGEAIRYVEGLSSFLGLIPGLQSLELNLPAFGNRSYPLNVSVVFPSYGIWPRLTTLTVYNLVTSLRDWICLITAQMPRMQTLEVGEFRVRDGAGRALAVFYDVAFQHTCEIRERGDSGALSRLYRFNRELDVQNPPFVANKVAESLGGLALAMDTLEHEVWTQCDLPMWMWHGLHIKDVAPKIIEAFERRLQGKEPT